MQVQINGKPSFAHLRIQLAPGEAVIGESDSMASMSPQVDLKATILGGFFKGLLRKYLGGESLFVNRFVNTGSSDSELVLTSPTPGDIIELDLSEGQEIYLQPGAFLACTPEVKLQLAFAGLVSFIAKEGLFKLRAKGPGKIWFSAYGALIEKELHGESIVDTAHLVAYAPGIKLKLQLAGGLISSFTSGEGLVTRLEGQGTYYIQSRSLSGLAGWINPKLY